MDRIIFEVKTIKKASLINAFKAVKIGIFSVKMRDDAMEFAVKTANRSSVIALLDKLCYNYREIGRAGAKHSFFALATRWGITIGVILTFALYLASSFFVLDIKVIGADEAVVKKLLAENGFSGIMKKSDVDAAATERLIIANMPTAAFAACVISGSVLKIEVHSTEDDETPKPAVTPIVSEYDAVVTRILTGSGTALVKEGDTVKSGDTLIDCYYETGEGEEKKRFEVPSDGAVFGRVWLKKQIALTDSDIVTFRTGNEKSFRTVQVCGIGKPASVEPPFSAYETETHTQTIFGILPIKVVETVYYELAAVDAGRSYAERLEAEIAKARQEFFAQAGEDAVINRVWTMEKKKDNYTIVEIYCETEQRIDNGGKFGKANRNYD